ncbi:potassium transporter [Hysterangium stoloniferum]|nr:potassium transporter [Hysterangium stoloniferum]
MALSWTRTWKFVRAESTFFRIHLLCFTIIPLICSGIFFACNGRFHVSYLDSAFLCYSAMTVTGLSTVNLSTITVWQQVILYLLMGIGDFTVGSWIMVLVRKSYFRRKCEYVRDIRSRNLTTRLRGSRTAFMNAISSPISVFPSNEPVPARPSGAHREMNVPESPAQAINTNPYSSSLPADTLSDSRPVLSESPRVDSRSLDLTPATPLCGVELVPTRTQRRHLTTLMESDAYSRPGKAIDTLPTTATVGADRRLSAKYEGFGGFPGPVTIAQRLFPEVSRKLERRLTIHHPTALVSAHSFQRHDSSESAQSVPWLRINRLKIRRNSFFQTDLLSDEELEKIGGVEYRALRLLSYLVAFYFVGTQLISFILIAPWLASTTEYDNVFAAQPRPVQKVWFSIFQVMSSYTGGGMSLVDLGMIPFQRAYLMIFSMAFVILAGNHALVRASLWIGYKLVEPKSEMRNTLSFLLKHPRRCFIYLFPMHQTWFLVACLVLFSLIEWVSFLVLDIGLTVTQTLPVGTRIIVGFFQGLAVRASGFSAVSISSLSPAVQFLYMVMMYIAVYPVAMTIRSTNVYEERSLGVFDLAPVEQDEEPELSGTRSEKLGKYLNWHLHRQLSIGTYGNLSLRLSLSGNSDIWWLVWAVFLICILERRNLLDEDKKWFDMFRVLFELVSAFGGIGLSLGLPTDNVSFSGALGPLSKLVVIVIMVRGRHRGLPVAVDRSILLPQELALGKQPNQMTPIPNDKPLKEG